MVTIHSFRTTCLSLPGAAEVPHFEKASFRVKNKIFATLDTKNKRACVKLSEIDQSVFCQYDPSVIYPVPNKWGKQGWTFIELTKVNKPILVDALTTAYKTLTVRKKVKK